MSQVSDASMSKICSKINTQDLPFMFEKYPNAKILKSDILKEKT